MRLDVGTVAQQNAHTPWLAGQLPNEAMERGTPADVNLHAGADCLNELAMREILFRVGVEGARALQHGALNYKDVHAVQSSGLVCTSP